MFLCGTAVVGLEGGERKGGTWEEGFHCAVQTHSYLLTVMSVPVSRVLCLFHTHCWSVAPLVRSHKQPTAWGL